MSYLFRKAGFTIVDIAPLAGFWVTVGQETVYFIYRANRGLLRKLRIIDLLALGIQAVAGLLDRLDCATEWSWMHMVVARKPAMEAAGDPPQPHRG